MEVIPVPLTDQLIPMNKIRTRTFFILNACLDTEILKIALDHLIRDHWRKLGARLVTRPEDGLLEYHLPRHFEDDRPLFNWSSQKYDHSIDRLDSLPKPTPPESGVSLLPPLSSLESWARPSDWPYELNDAPDAPLLYVHISLFTDATVMATSLPHVVGDQFGLANIIKAWLGQINDEVPPSMIGFDDDLFTNEKSYADYPAEDVVRIGRERVMGNMEHAFAIAPLIPDLIMNWKEVAHTLFFPLSLVQSLRERHANKLTKEYGIDCSISNGDIMTAILLKFSQMQHRSTQTLSLTQAVNLRGRLPQLGPDNNAFIHNAVTYATARIQLNASTSLGEIAYQNRQAIIQAMDPKDIEIALVVKREMVRRKQQIHTCEPFERFFNVTNWAGAWRGLDFSAAIKCGPDMKNKSTTLDMLVLGMARPKYAPDRYGANILCKTSEGYWCRFTASTKTITLVKEYLKTDPRLENL